MGPPNQLDDCSDWVVGLVLVGDQGALVGCADLPVPPDPGGQRAGVGRPGHPPRQGAAAVAFQPKLVFEGVVDARESLGLACSLCPGSGGATRVVGVRPL